MKTNTLFLTLATALLLTACTSEEKRIEKTAYKYSFALANYDVDGAERYATPETVETTLQTARGLLPMVDTNYIKSDTPATIEIKHIEIIDDTSAYVTFHKHTPIKDFDHNIAIRKRGRHWLAHDPIPVRKAPLPEGMDDQVAEE